MEEDTAKTSKTAPFFVAHLTMSIATRIDGRWLDENGQPTLCGVSINFLLECEPGDGAREKACSLAHGRVAMHMEVKGPAGAVPVASIRGAMSDEFEDFNGGSKSDLDRWLATAAERVLAKAQAIGLSPKGALCRALHDLEGSDSLSGAPPALANANWIISFVQEVSARREAIQIGEEVATGERESSDERAEADWTQKRTPRAL